MLKNINLLNVVLVGFLLLKQRDFKYLFEIVPSKREAADRPKHPRRLRGQLKIIFLIEYRKKA